MVKSCLRLNEAFIESLFGKKIKVISTNNKIWVGKMDYFSGSNDEVLGLFVIGLDFGPGKHGITLNEDEIQSIEVID